MIVKVQVSVSGTPGALIYNRSRSILFQTRDPEEILYLQKCLNPKVKGYFRAKVVDRNIKLLARLRDRNW